MKDLKIKNRLRKNKKIKTKKKCFDETLYTIDQAKLEKFKSYLRRKGINELNYLFITINCPKRLGITDKKKQFDFLVNLLKSLGITYVACFEWSDERSNGYHVHFIVSEEEFNIELIPYELLVDDLFHKSELLVNNSLDRCLGYLCKERKGCTTANRKEKFYFSNIEERKLVSIGLRPVIQEETPIHTVEAQSEQVVNHPHTKPKKELKGFFKDLLKKVKTVISRLFIRNQEQHYYDYKKKIICQSTRDGPA